MGSGSGVVEKNQAANNAYFKTYSSQMKGEVIGAS
jgi:hypothetical protein